MASPAAHPPPEPAAVPVVHATIPFPAEWHGRNAAQVVKLEQSFDADLRLECCGRRSNARSLMSLLELDADRCTELHITASGPDAEPMIRAIHDLFASEFRGTDYLPDCTLFRQKFACHFHLA